MFQIFINNFYIFENNNIINIYIMEPIPKVTLPTPYNITKKLTTLNKIGKEKISDFLGS